VLAKLDRLEREQFLTKHLGWSATDPPASQAVWRAAIFDLPEEMDDDQLEAWIELAELAADESFRAALDRQLQSGKGIDAARATEWSRTSQRLLADALRELGERANPDRRMSEGLLDAWIDGLAKLHSRAPDTEFVRWLLEHFESLHDARMAQYWRLVARLRRMPPQQNVYSKVFAWLLRSLQARLS
jgi:hypothetical protein